MNSPERSALLSILRRTINRGIRPLAAVVALISAATALLIGLGADPNVTRVSGGVVRVTLAAILAVAAILALIRVFRARDRWGIPSAILFGFIGIAHATTTSDLTRGPVSGVLSEIAITLCFITTIAIIVVVSESRPSSTGSHLR